MQKWPRSLTRPLSVVLACVITPLAAHAVDDTPLTKEQIKRFLQTPKSSRASPRARASLIPGGSPSTITHDASFQSIDKHKSKMKFASGKVELDFVDSYKYNITAYRLAELVGLDEMLPVYVERKWQGKTVSFDLGHKTDHSRFRPLFVEQFKCQPTVRLSLRSKNGRGITPNSIWFCQSRISRC